MQKEQREKFHVNVDSMNQQNMKIGQFCSKRLTKDNWYTEARPKAWADSKRSRTADWNLANIGNVYSSKN